MASDVTSDLTSAIHVESTRADNLTSAAAYREQSLTNRPGCSTTAARVPADDTPESTTPSEVEEAPELPSPPLPPPLTPVKNQPKMVVDASHVIHNRLVLAMYSLYLNGNTLTTGCPADEQRDLATRLRELEDEAEQLQNRADDVTHRVKMELATLKTKMLKERGKIEQERDREHNPVAGCPADEQRDLATRLHELENEAELLKSRADDVTCRRNTELATFQKGMLKEQDEMERERDRQHNLIADLTRQVETLKLTCENLTQKLDEKERELVKSVQAVRDEQWQKQHMRDRMKELADAKEAAEKEALVAKTKVQHQQSLTEQLEREHTENSELRLRLHRIEKQFANYVESMQELNELNEKSIIQVERLTSKLERTEKEVAASKSTSAEILMENKSNWTVERLQLQTRISELNDARVKATTRLTNYISTEKRKKKKIAKTLTELKARNKMLQAKLEQLETENQMLKWSIVPSGDRLKQQLRDLWRHHQEFNSIILSGYNCSSLVPGAEIDLSSIAVPYKSPSVPTSGIAVNSLGVQQKDLEHLKERLDRLDDIQRRQLNKLRGYQDCTDNSQVKASDVKPQ